jgi:L-lactate dehydrogenase complex protein LldG
LNARDDILARLRAARERGGRTRAAGLADVQAAFAAPVRGPRPAPAADPAERVERFRREALRMSSSVDEVADLDAVPAAVARYLAQAGLAPHGVVWPRLAALGWAAAGLTMAARAARDEDRVGVTGCFCAIAETGTLMTCSAPDSPAATSLLPETHIAVVPASRIVAGMEEGWALARSELGELPRAVNFISGPSRTGDIEMTIVLGAHGPARVHLILVRAA